MAPQKKSVDEIWKELNARPTGRGGTMGTCLGGSSNLPGITTVSRIIPKSASGTQSTAPSPMQGIITTTPPVTKSEAGLHINLATMQEAPLDARSKITAQYDPVKAGVTSEDVQAYLSGLQRTVNCLSDPDRTTRKQAISMLLIRLTKGDASGPAPDPKLLQALVCGPLLYPLTTMLHDQGEAARLAAAELLGHASRIVSDMSPALPFLMPEILQRMGHLPVVEPAEEVRLLLTGLIADIVQGSNSDTLKAYAPDICLFLLRALEDPYHDIKKAACTCTSTLAKKAPSASIEPHAEKLLQALLPNLQHQHSRVRLAIIEALGALISAGAVPSNLVESVAAPALRPVAYDRAPAVREALFISIAQWLGYIRDKDKVQEVAEAGTTGHHHPEADPLPRSTAATLLPLIIVGVSDPQSSLALLALQLVEGVGGAWCESWAKTRAGPSNATACSTGSDTEMVVDSVQPVGDEEPAGQRKEPKDSDEDQAAFSACQLGAPYQGRPGFGARYMVQELLQPLLQPLLTDLAEWTVALRSCAARQLHTVLVFAEGGITEQLPRLLPALCSSIGDETAEVASSIIASVHVVGAHTSPKRWLPLMLDNICNARLSLIQKANALVVLAGLLHTAAKVQQQRHLQGQVDLPSDLLLALAASLCSDDMRANEHPAIRLQLLSTATNTIRLLGPRSSEVVQQLYTLLLQLYGFEKDPLRLRDIRQVMSELAATCGKSAFEELAESHAPAVMEAACQEAGKWSAEAPSYLVFRALLLTSGPSTLSILVPKLCGALAPILADHDGGEPSLKLGALQLLDALMEDQERGNSLAGEAAGMVLSQLLLPPMVWRAGKTAAAIRFSAMTAFATMLRRHLVPAPVLMQLVAAGSILPLINQSLDEDWYTDLRNTSCFVMELLLLLLGPELSEEARRVIYPELLKRLDDSSNQVRIAACRSLLAFCTTMSPRYCNTNTGYLVQGVVIHMDDSNTEVQEAACCVLEAAAVVKPEVVSSEVKKVRDRFRSKHYCDRVLAAAERG